MRSEPSERALLVGAHQQAVADDIGREYCCQFADNRHYFRLPFMSPAPVVREKRSKPRNRVVGNVSRPSVMAPCSGRDRARRRMMIAVDSSRWRPAAAPRTGGNARKRAFPPSWRLETIGSSIGLVMTLAPLQPRRRDLEVWSRRSEVVRTAIRLAMLSLRQGAFITRRSSRAHQSRQLMGHLVRFAS